MIVEKSNMSSFEVLEKKAGSAFFPLYLHSKGYFPDGLFGCEYQQEMHKDATGVSVNVLVKSVPPASMEKVGQFLNKTILSVRMRIVEKQAKKFFFFGEIQTSEYVLIDVHVNEGFFMDNKRKKGVRLIIQRLGEDLTFHTGLKLGKVTFQYVK